MKLAGNFTFVSVDFIYCSIKDSPFTLQLIEFNQHILGNGEEEPVILKKKKKIGKNPAVNTSFLPDKDREAQELQEIGNFVFKKDDLRIFFYPVRAITELITELIFSARLES